MAVAIGGRRRFLAKEGIFRESLGQPVADQQFGVEAGLARQILRALVVNGEIGPVVEVAERQFARLANEF